MKTAQQVLTELLEYSTNLQSYMSSNKIILKSYQVGSQQWNDGLKKILESVDYFGNMINNYKKLSSQSEKVSKIDYLNHLVKFANYLDKQGAFALADKVTETAELFNYANFNSLLKFSDYLRNNGNYALAEKVCEVEKLSNEEFPIKPMNEVALSSRYCPDHRGVQVFRIDERVYQCPIDGKIYDYLNGYKNYDGQIVPGGSVANQTPHSFDSGGISIRFYDPNYNSI